MLGEKIKSLRLEKNMTQEEFAESLCISRPALSLYESNKRKPDFEVLKKIAEYFNVSIDFLLDNNIKDKTNYPNKNSSSSNEIDEEVEVLVDMIYELDKDDRETVIKILDALINKHK
ncbi:helix-turn-helix domain-containing protein [Clostridioides difficile]|uniref:helix-turn-helix domain-containing protein n=1 Tax=Clostridioides difficile TaxID=1496 RepID=UPI000D4A005F|nr:helix-turn-helix transcriptional regulator [Clostridioides difficile]MBF9991461.1 helix-turn-helix transcriptional regulator [Clostridioides difficile]MBZ1092954.1 helix-turn-helix domain-containing protein [Clostridioides difficile]MBZ4462719.1 helix-turn-helix domain-containing protein [Clostridioides difficile]MCI9972583.1 helix-turn-helix transcriptional regulator [Clostridioides difficile]MCJ0114941.1 helix-turn-helix transcriptional regulator [Clostridioides difficile]